MFDQVASLVTSPWVYVLILVAILADVFLPVIPSGTLLITASVYAVHAGGTSAMALLVVATLASFLGDIASYQVGAHASGRVLGFVARHDAEGRMRTAFTARGGRFMLVARFLPAGRSVTTMVAGATAFPAARFRVLSLMTALVWSGYSVGLGFLAGVWLGGSWESLALALGAVFALTLLGMVVKTRRSAHPAAASSVLAGGVPVH